MNNILPVQGNSTPALHGAGAGGSKGVNAVSPSPDVCGGSPHVAGPLSGGIASPSGDTMPPDQRRRGRPMSGKSKMRFCFTPRLASRLKHIPHGVRGHTVETAVTLFLDAQEAVPLDQLCLALWNLFIRLSQLRGLLAGCGTLSVEKRARAAAFCAAVACKLEGILCQLAGAGKAPADDDSDQLRSLKTKLSFSPAVTTRLKSLTKGKRRRTVEIAVTLLLEGPGMEWFERVFPELSELSSLLQHVLETLAVGPTLTEEKRARAEAIGAAAIGKLGRIFEL